MPNPSTRRALTPSQADLMETLTRLGNGAPVGISTTKLATESGLTPKQVDAALNGLINASTLTKTWDPDRYVWIFTLNVPAAGA